VSDHKAYVTELYANKIWIVDYKKDSVIGSIAVAGWTEQLLQSNGSVYVLEKKSPTGQAIHKLLQINTATDVVVNSMNFTSDPLGMVLTAPGKLTVLTDAQATPAISASLYQIDLSAFSILRKINFQSSHTPGYLRYSSLTHQLLYADNGICQMELTDTVVATGPFIASNNWNVYGLNTDPATGDIYISDAIDYQQASKVMRYSKEGVLIDAFNAGIITNGCYFK
jgi:DNA-binding beta-propeller fold protein YncE